jgi:metal-responsive CopG/Arc/MetJ family transcriptional regulator
MQNITTTAAATFGETASYDLAIQGLESLVASTHNVFESAQDVMETFEGMMLRGKAESEQTDKDLRDLLAQNKSLRRKDFDGMMMGIFATQTEMETEIRTTVKSYFTQQKQTTQTLTEILSNVKVALAKGEAGRIAEFQKMMTAILARQDERKRTITALLKDFQRDQEQLITQLKSILAHARTLRIKDFKAMLDAFAVQQQARQRERRERRAAVQELLDTAKKHRLEFNIDKPVQFKK